MRTGHELGDGWLVEQLWLGFVWVLALGVPAGYFSLLGVDEKREQGAFVGVGRTGLICRDRTGLYPSVSLGCLIGRVVIYDVHESLRFLNDVLSFLSDALKICIVSTAAAHVSSSSGGRRIHTSNEAR